MKKWTLSGFDQLSEGTLGNGGQNLYVSKKGGLQRIWRFDVNNDGYVDLLIDGEYVQAYNDGKSLKGSSNQRVLFLTERYLPYRELYAGSTRNAEVRLSGNDVFFVGIPSKQTWQQWRAAVEEVDGQKKQGNEEK